MSETRLKSKMPLTSSLVATSSSIKSSPQLLSTNLTSSSRLHSANSTSLTSSLLTNTMLNTSSLLSNTKLTSTLTARPSSDNLKKKLAGSNSHLIETDLKKLKVTDNVENRAVVNLQSSLSNKMLPVVATRPLLVKTNMQMMNLSLETKKRPLFHLNSQNDDDQKESSNKVIVIDDDQSLFVQQELAQAQLLIETINKENKRRFAELVMPNKKVVLVNEQQIFSKKVDQVGDDKIRLINLVSAALLYQPDFKSASDPTRSRIMQGVDQIIGAHHDPEFIVKLALYTRRELNIRVVANFLLCLAAYRPECRPFLKRYFKHSIMLPNDWIDVAEQYQLLMDKRINFGSLPHALRKCMMDKFPDFDQYQLAKYNKEKSRLAKNKKIKDMKHIKAKLKLGVDDDSSAKVAVDKKGLTEEKYIKTWKKGLKLNDRILFEVVVANENCTNVKFDIVDRQEEAETPMKMAMARAKARLASQMKRKTGKSSSEVQEQVAMRINLDYVVRRITHRSFLKKAWTPTRFSDSVCNPKNFDFKKSQTPIMFFIDIAASEFRFGYLKDNSDTEVLLSKYLHTKHQLQLSTLNCIRVSGVGVKLKDLVVKSKNEVVTQLTSTDETNETEMKRRSFTLKQLIRQLHISQPVENVMCLLGKKYPATMEEFMELKLPGIFDSERANKRMKLPVPETWETQLSLKGNKAEVWQQLIDNKKLPYMAMLRNLRNMIVCGISDKHHQWVTKKLQDEGAVVNSKLFPFRFFTAYEVLDELEEEFNSYVEWSKTSLGAAATTTKPAHKNKEDKKVKKDVHYDLDILKRYKQALDNALKVATAFNLSPIKGRTAIVLDLGPRMDQAPQSRSAKSLGKKVTSLSDISSLLGLMFNYACEYSRLVIFKKSFSLDNAELSSGTILENMKLVKEAMFTHKGSQCLTENGTFPRNRFLKMLNDKELFDNIVVLSCGIDGSDVQFVQEFLTKYRALVNPQLLFVNVNLGISENSNDDASLKFNHENDVNVSGFSDSILRFVAERSNQGQLTYIDNIDRAYDLPEIKSETKEQAKSQVQATIKPEKPRLKVYSTASVQWTTLKVFISSTFRDMHSERDILTKTVFPMLRGKLSSRLINLYEIDLRWGITEQEAHENQTLDLCLSQVLASDYFIAMLGERYGHLAPIDPTDNKYMCRRLPGLEWLDRYERGASITELEIQTQLEKEAKSASSTDRAFFYFRDHDSFIDQVPNEYIEDFEESNSENTKKLEKLKDKLRKSNKSLEIFDGYRAKWLKYESGRQRALLTGLDQFALRVFNNLFNAILNEHGNRANIELDEIEHWNQLTMAYVRVCSESFVGRQKLVKKFAQLLHDNQWQVTHSASTQAAVELANKKNSLSDIYLILGDHGSGKSTFLSHVVDKGYMHNSFAHFVGSFPGSENVNLFLRRLCIQLARQFRLESVDVNDLMSAGYDFDYFKATLADLLRELNKKLVNEKFFIIVDSVDMLVDDLNNPDHTFSWLPVSSTQSNEYSKISFVFTAKPSSPTKLALKNLSKLSSESHLRYSLVEIENLDLLEKSEFVRLSLSKYGKYLDETPFNNQMKLLIGKREAATPIYLTLAVEELRLNAHFETLNDKIKELPMKLNQLVDYILVKLEENYTRRFVQACFTFICSSRDGLYETELDDLLNIYYQTISFNIDIGSASRSVFSLVGSDISDKLFARSNQIAPVKFVGFLDSIRQIFLSPSSDASLIRLKKNEVIENCLRSRYTTTIKTDCDALTVPLAYRIMSVYYYHLLDNRLERNWAEMTRNQRALTYLPFYLSQASLDSDLAEILTSFGFISNKCQTRSGVFELMEDFDGHKSSIGKNILLESNGKLSFARSSAISKRQVVKCDERTESALQSKSFLDYKRFFATNYHLINQNAASIYQQAINEPASSQPRIDLINLLRTNPRAVSANLLISLSNQASDQVNAEPVIINDLGSIITSVAVSKDGQLVACGTADCDIRLYSLSTATLLRTFKGHSGEITSLLFVGGENSNVLCSASADGKASLWNISDGFRIKVLNKHNGHVVSGVGVDPRLGKTLITVGWDCTIKIWSPKDGNNLGEIRGLTKPINCVAFDPTNENMIATGSWDSVIRLFNIVDRSRKAILRGHQTSIRSVAYSFTGVYLASSSMDCQIKLWNSRIGVVIATLLGHSQPVNSVAFSPTSQFLVSGSSDRRMRVWNGSVGNLRRVIRHEEPLTSVEFDKYNNSEYVAVGTHSGHVKLYQTESGKLVGESRVHKAQITRIKFTKYSEFLVTTALDGSIRVTKIFENKSIRPIAELVNETMSPVSALAVRVEDDLIVVGNNEASLLVYSNVTKEITDLASVKVVRPVHRLSGHKSAITSCSFDPSGSRLATASKDAYIIVWSVDTSSKMLEISELFTVNSAHMDWITDLQWSTNGERLITCANDFKLKIWSTADELDQDRKEAELSGHVANLNACSYTHGLVASACSDGSVKIWLAGKAYELTTLYGHQSHVNSCDLGVMIDSDEARSKQKRDKRDKRDQENDDDMDDATMLELFGESPIQETSQETSSIKIRRRRIEESEAMSDNFKGQVYLATVSDDFTLRIWSPLESNPLLTLEKHNDSINQLALSHSHHLAAASSDKSVTLWNMSDCFGHVNKGNDVTGIDQIKSRYSEVTCLKAIGDYVLSGYLDGHVIVWRVVRQLTDNTPDRLEFVHEIKVSNNGITSICVLELKDTTNSSKKEIVFATSSYDCFVKLWVLTIEDSTVFAESKTPLRLEGPIHYMSEFKSQSGKTHLIALINSADHLAGRIVNYEKRALQRTYRGFNVIDGTNMLGSIVSRASIDFSNHLHVNLIHGEIIEVDLNECVKANVATSVMFHLNDTTGRYKKCERGKSSSDVLFTSNLVLQDARWPVRLVGDSRGHVYSQSNSSASLIKIKAIHTDRVVELVKYDKRQGGVESGRVISASSDGYIRIWTANFDTQLGQFYNKSGGVTKITRLDKNGHHYDGEFIVYGDQMGNLNILKWHENDF